MTDPDVETVREALDEAFVHRGDPAHPALDRLVQRLAKAEQRNAELERVLQSIQGGVNAGGSM